MSTSERSGPEPVHLGPLETQVMEVVWSTGPVTIREIITALPHEPAYTTIATVLHHLARKGMAVSSKDGRSTRYAAKTTREEHAAGVMQHALAASPDRATSILHFVDTMASDDVAMLRDYLDRHGDHR